MTEVPRDLSSGGSQQPTLIPGFNRCARTPGSPPGSQPCSLTAVPSRSRPLSARRPGAYSALHQDESAGGLQEPEATVLPGLSLCFQKIRTSAWSFLFRTSLSTFLQINTQGPGLAAQAAVRTQKETSKSTSLAWR